jgi:O-antigen ligase
VIFPVFVASGTLKSLPAMSGYIDLTLVTAVAIALLAFGAAINMVVARTPQGLGWLICLVAVVLAGLWQTPDSAYATSKVQGLLTLTLGCSFVGALLVLRTNQHRRWLLRGTVGVGLAMCVVYVLNPTPDAALDGRIALHGSNTIQTARYAGAALVVVITFMLSRRRWSLPALACATALGLLMIGTGSRGPLVATVISLLSLVPVHTKDSRRLRRRAAALAVVVAAVGFYLFTKTDALARSRIDLLFAQDKGASVSERTTMWGLAWRAFEHAPLGLGWGGLQPKLMPIDIYPHDILLEVLGEAGLIGACALVLLLCGAYARAYAHARRGDVDARGLLVLLTFWLVNALVSGDVNDNRGLFVVAAAAVVMSRPRREGARDHPGTAESTAVHVHAQPRVLPGEPATAQMFQPGSTARPSTPTGVS